MWNGVPLTEFPDGSSINCDKFGAGLRGIVLLTEVKSARERATVSIHSIGLGWNLMARARAGYFGIKAVKNGVIDLLRDEAPST